MDYTTLKHTATYYFSSISFTTILDYTTLKPKAVPIEDVNSFTTILDYTTLKPDMAITDMSDKFYYHLGLHYSQTFRIHIIPQKMFYYHLGLHYSQTCHSVTSIN